MTAPYLPVPISWEEFSQMSFGGREIHYSVELGSKRRRGIIVKMEAVFAFCPAFVFTIETTNGREMLTISTFSGLLHAEWLSNGRIRINDETLTVVTGEIIIYARDDPNERTVVE